MGKPNLRAMAVCFQPHQWFPHGFDGENSESLMWVYRPDTCGDRWLVGFFYPDGGWFTESSFDEKDKAAARVNYLNGGSRD